MAGFAGAAAGSDVLGAVAAVAAELDFVSEPSFVPANTGATNTTANNELQSQLFRFISYVVLRNREPFIEIDKHHSLHGSACSSPMFQSAFPTVRDITKLFGRKIMLVIWKNPHINDQHRACIKDQSVK